MATRPGQPVAKGGLWSTAKQPAVSKDTAELLKVMMEESKLTNFQSRQLQDSVKQGKSLPVDCNPSSSKKKEEHKTQRQKKPTQMNGRHLQYSGKRRKEIIDALREQQQNDQYKPSPGKMITDKDKEKLQNMMAYGKDVPERKVHRDVRPAEAEFDDSSIDRFDEVMQEIEERRQFLDKMTALGQGEKYRKLISTEISQKIRELELIDKERNHELQLELKCNQNKN